MFVLPVERVLELDEIPTHEEVCADLVEHVSGDVLFISHTWLRGNHPDTEDGVKLKLLQALLVRFVHGNSKIGIQWAAKMAYGLFNTELLVPRGQLRSCKYVWLDRWSIPQADDTAKLRGIESIASYIQSCRWFFILCGAWRHENGSVRDVRAWGTRGWCRLEQLANALACDRQRLIICAQSPSSVVSYGPSGLLSREWCTHPVGHGDFFSADDRFSLGPVILRMIERRKEAALLQGDLLMYRVLHACTNRLLVRTGTLAPVEATLDEWLVSMRFRSTTEGARSGFTPLFFAALAGERDDLVAELLRRGAKPNTSVRPRGRASSRAAQSCGLLNGYGPLHAACCSEQPKVVQLLLEHGANPLQSESQTRATALHVSAMYGCIANAEALLAHSRSLLTTCNRFGQTALFFAVLFGRVEYFQRFIGRDEKRVLLPAANGHSLVNAAVMQVGDLQTLEAVIERTLALGGSVDLTARSRGFAWGVLERVADLADKFSMNLGATLEELAYAVRGTALHQAAYEGNLGAVELCLAHGADVRAVVAHSPHRFEALHLAAMQGHEAIVDRLLAAGAQRDARDAKGRTAEWWAWRRGWNLEALQRSRLSSTGGGAPSAYEPGKRKPSSSTSSCCSLCCSCVAETEEEEEKAQTGKRSSLEVQVHVR